MKVQRTTAQKVSFSGIEMNRLKSRGVNRANYGAAEIICTQKNTGDHDSNYHADRD